MPWLAKALLFALKTKRGRELLFAGVVGAAEAARSERGRRLFATGRREGREAVRLVRETTRKFSR